MLDLVVREVNDDNASDFTFSTPSQKSLKPRVTFKTVEEATSYVDEKIPANYFIKLNTDVEE